MTPVFLKTALFSGAILIGHLSSVHAAAAAADNSSEFARTTRRMTITPQDVLAEVETMKNPGCDVAFLKTAKGEAAIRETVDDYNKEADSSKYVLGWTYNSKNFHATNIVNQNSFYNMWRIALVASRKKS